MAYAKVNAKTKFWLSYPSPQLEPKTLATINIMMSSKVILLNETISIPHDLRNLSGYEFSLQDFPTHDYDESVRLYSLHFCERENLEEIWNKANTLIALINGGLNLYLKNSDRDINLSAKCITDPFLNSSLYSPSNRNIFSWSNPFDKDEFEKNRLNSSFVPREHFINKIINLCTSERDVFDLLILNSLERNLTNLYKLYETVAFYFTKELGIKLSDGLEEYKIYKSTIRSFKQTANHGNYNVFQLMSYDVRHGRNKNPDNFKKMELNHAVKLIQKIISVYLNIKYGI